MKRMLTATFILSLTAALNIEASAQEFPNFEAELQAMEKNQLNAEEIQMNNVDAVTDVISDDVSTGQAGIQKASEEPDTDETIMMTKAQKEKVRRVRSRPL